MAWAPPGPGMLSIHLGLLMHTDTLGRPGPGPRPWRPRGSQSAPSSVPRNCPRPTPSSTVPEVSHPSPTKPPADEACPPEV